MEQRQNQTLSQRFQQYRASKAVLFWACAGSVIVATIVGFSWGGWVTGGSAAKMAEKSAAQARQELAAVVCVDRFMGAPDVGVQLTALKDIESPYAQGKFVEDGGWAIIVPASSPRITKRGLITARRPGCAPRSLRSARWPRPVKPPRSPASRPSRNRARDTTPRDLINRAVLAEGLTHAPLEAKVTRVDQAGHKDAVRPRLRAAAFDRREPVTRRAAARDAVPGRLGARRPEVAPESGTHRRKYRRARIVVEHILAPELAAPLTLMAARYG
jgi:hypothetical protein